MYKSKFASAERDARRSEDIISAFAHAASAAEMLLAAGYHESAQDVLATVKRAHIAFLRYRVAREPGGVLHEEVE